MSNYFSRLVLLPIAIFGMLLLGSCTQNETTPTVEDNSDANVAALATALTNAETDSPGARTWHGVVFDPASNALLLSGGRDAADQAGQKHKDIWKLSFETNQWEMLSAEFPPVELDMSVLNTQENNLLLVGSGAQVNAPATMLEYDLISGELHELDVPDALVRRIEPGLVYHPSLNQILLFGGQRAWDDPLDDTWLFDAETASWVQIATEQSPSARGRFAMAYDSDADRILLHGGSDGFLLDGKPQHDTWEYDPVAQTWSEIVTENGPQFNVQVTGTYDAQSQKFIVFGRTINDGHETWAFDYTSSSWTNMNPSGGPAIGHPGEAIYVPSLDRMLIYGGAVDWPTRPDVSGELWAYDYETNAWQLLNE